MIRDSGREHKQMAGREGRFTHDYSYEKKGEIMIDIAENTVIMEMFSKGKLKV